MSWLHAESSWWPDRKIGDKNLFSDRGEQTKNEMRICILFATIQTFVYWVLMAAQKNIRMSKICLNFTFNYIFSVIS